MPRSKLTQVAMDGNVRVFELEALAASEIDLEAGLEDVGFSYVLAIRQDVVEHDARVRIQKPVEPKGKIVQLAAQDTAVIQIQPGIPSRQLPGPQSFSPPNRLPLGRTRVKVPVSRL